MCCGWRRDGRWPMAEPRRPDELGLGQALGERFLSLLVAAMVLLAALALAGALAAGALSRHWQDSTQRQITVQVPQPDAKLPPKGGVEETRIDRVLAQLRNTEGVARAQTLSADALAGLLRPWLGEAAPGSLPLPGVIQVDLGLPPPDLDALAGVLEAAAPGTLTERHDLWEGRLRALASSLEACAWLVLLLVLAVAASVVMVATRAELAARREQVEIVHGLGAEDGMIAGRFAQRALRLAGLGGVLGTVAALPVLAALAGLARPFAREAETGSLVPVALWFLLPLLPVLAGGIGWLTAQITVRRWLRLLP
jgi:cell division transport system permease protein